MRDSASVVSPIEFTTGTTLKRFEKGHRKPIPVVRAAIFAALEKAGVEFHHDGKRLGVSISVRKVAKGLTK